LEQVGAVEETLEEIGAGDKPTVMALNKVDGIELPKNNLGGEATARFLGQWLEDFPDAVPISALQSLGLTDLLERVESVLSSHLVEVRVRIPYNASELVSLFHRKGIVDREDYSPRGTLLVGKLPQALLPEFERYRVSG
jgi:GTP-binding protein HflX